MKKITFYLYFLCLCYGQTMAQHTFNMTLLSEWDPDTLATTNNGREFNDIWGYTDCDGGEYAILGSAAKIHFINVTDPTNPVEINSFEGGGVSTWRDMKTFGDRAYAVADAVPDGLMIFDLSALPDAVTKTYHSTQFFGEAHNIFIDEANGRLYAVGTDQATDMIILDIATNPDVPILLANVTLPGGGSVHDVYVRDNIAYCSHGNQGYYIWDCSDATNPILMAGMVTGGYNHSSWVSDDGQFAVFAEEVPLGMPLGIMDLSALAENEISVSHTFKFPLLAPEHENNVPHNPFIRGQYAIVSYYHDGLQIFDLSDPLNPQQVAWYDSHPQNTIYSGYQGNWGVYPYLPSGNIIISDINEGLLVLSADNIIFDEVEQVSAPEIVISVPESFNICEGETALSYVTTNGTTFQWYKDGVPFNDTNNPLEITEAGSYYCEATTGHCSAISETVDIVLDDPVANIIVTGSLIICPGETILLQSEAIAESYQWILDGDAVVATNSELLTGIPGNYTLMTTIGNCSAVSESITIEAKPFPDTSVDIVEELSFCPGASVQLTATGEALTYSWYKDGELFSNAASITATEAGMYELLVNDEFCEHSSEPFEVIVFPETVPEFIFDWTYLGVSPGLHYQWYYEGEPIPGGTEQIFIPELDGSYSVELVDYNSCVVFSEEIMITVTNVNSLDKNKGIKLFPNPVDHILYIESLSNVPISNFVVSNISGKLMGASYNTQNKIIEIETGNWPQGVYLLKYEQDGEYFVRKITKI